MYVLKIVVKNENINEYRTYYLSENRKDLYSNKLYFTELDLDMNINNAIVTRRPEDLIVKFYKDIKDLDGMFYNHFGIHFDDIKEYEFKITICEVEISDVFKKEYPFPIYG